jgi:integrase
MTIGVACNLYFVQKVEGKPNDIKIEAELDALAARLGEDTWLHEIDTAMVARAVADRSKEVKKTGRGRGVDLVSPATVNRDTTQLLRRVMRRAEKVWKPQMPAEPIEWGEVLLEETEGRTRELLGEEEASLIPALPDDLLAPFTLAIITGLRQAPVLQLKWSQYSPLTRTIIIRLKSKKPGGRVHTVPLTDEAIDIIESQRDRHDTYVFTYVCKKSRGKRKQGQRYPFSQSGWQKGWRAAMADAGITDFRWHDLRHTAATRTLRVSNLPVVQRLLGHKSVVSTMRYAHATVDDVAKAINAVGDIESRKNSRNDADRDTMSLKQKA